MLVILDIQHMGKPTHQKISDWGAVNDLDHSGTFETGEQEAALTYQYVGHAAFALRDLGHSVIILADGWYSERHQRANKYSHDINLPSIYIAAHVNAGGGNYGAIFYDYRSARGWKLSETMGKHLEFKCHELTTVKTIISRPDDWTKNAFSTISGIMSPIGICYEPFFLDNQNHAILATSDGLQRIGEAIANAVDEYSEGV